MTSAIDYSRYVAPKPTTYAGVRFRSRLEARWAAMFDRLSVQWAYEPLDLQGWTPDFRLTVHAPVWADDDGLNPSPSKIGETTVAVFAEVKPAYGDDMLGLDCFSRAVRRCRDVWVLCLGAGPGEHSIGALCDPPASGPNGVWWVDVHEALCGVVDDTWPDHESLWNLAGMDVQWKGNAA
jgi:hypothetical protein